MSAAAVFQQVLRIVVGQDLPAIAQENIVAALEAGRPGPLEMLYEAGEEAQLSAPQIIARAAACYFFFCTANLCDDLSDGDATYLSEPYRAGPCAQLAIQNLFFRALVEMELPSGALSNVLDEFTAMAGGQHVELDTKRWTAAVYRQVAEGIAGRQWSAYLQLVWFGTPMEDRAERIGSKLGIAAHVAKDIESGDPRYTSLADRDKREIITWALRATHELHLEHLSCVDAVLLTVNPVLEGIQR